MVLWIEQCFIVMNFYIIDTVQFLDNLGLKRKPVQIRYDPVTVIGSLLHHVTAKSL